MQGLERTAEQLDKRVKLATKKHGALLAKRAKRKVAIDCSIYRDDPVGFAINVLKEDPEKLWDELRTMMTDVRDNALVAVKGANGVGKDHVAAILALWWVYCVEGLVVITGTTKGQVTSILFAREIKKMWARSGLEGECYRAALLFEDEDPDDPSHGIIGVVSDDISRLSGHHAPHVLCIVSEAQKVGDYVFEAMFGNAVGAEDRILVEGNPLQPTGPFYAAFGEGSAWHTLTINAMHHPNVVQKRIVIPGAITWQGVQRIKRNWGEGSAYWQGHVLAEFPETTSDSVFIKIHCLAAFKRSDDGEFRSRTNGMPLVVSWDVAAGGDDENAAAVWQGPVWHEIKTWQDPDLMNSARIVSELAMQYGMQRIGDRPMNIDPVAWGSVPGKITVDVTGGGLGKGPVDALREMGWDVEPFDFAGAPPDGEEGRWKNRRVWAYFHLREAMRDGKVAGPFDQMLLEEMLATRYLLGTDSGKGGVQLIPKKEIKAVLGHSPDRLDALVMGYAVYDEVATIGGDSGNYGF